MSAEGMLAPLALPGTVLPDGSRLEKSVIRGERSEGMLCSDAELGLGDNPGGIMVLESSLKVGRNLAQSLGLSDTVFELDLTPNRPDCLSVIGIAREIAAIQKTPLKYPDYAIADQTDTIHKLASVTNRGAGPLPPLFSQAGGKCQSGDITVLAPGSAAVGRSAADQQYRRYHQFCHDGDRPAAACL